MKYFVHIEYVTKRPLYVIEDAVLSPVMPRFHPPPSIMPIVPLPCMPMLWLLESRRARCGRYERGKCVATRVHRARSRRDNSWRRHWTQSHRPAAQLRQSLLSVCRLSVTQNMLAVSWANDCMRYMYHDQLMTRSLDSTTKIKAMNNGRLSASILKTDRDAPIRLLASHTWSRRPLSSPTVRCGTFWTLVYSSADHLHQQRCHNCRVR